MDIETTTSHKKQDVFSENKSMFYLFSHYFNTGSLCLMIILLLKSVMVRPDTK